jgi:hypothetical protein
MWGSSALAVLSHVAFKARYGTRYTEAVRSLSEEEDETLTFDFTRPQNE